jgi:thiamine-phosphate pyrophosphorylase
MPLDIARSLIGDSMLVGISVESLEEAVQAEAGGADYLGVSSIYPTPTKTDTVPPLGLQGLRAIRRAVSLPLVGIGGLNQQNAAPVIQHGADGIAVVSAIVAAADPEQAAWQLRQEITRVKFGS